jgi:hypothetical protein
LSEDRARRKAGSVFVSGEILIEPVIVWFPKCETYSLGIERDGMTVHDTCG